VGSEENRDLRPPGHAKGALGKVVVPDQDGGEAGREQRRQKNT